MSVIIIITTIIFIIGGLITNMREDIYLKIEDVARKLNISDSLIRKYQLQIEAEHDYRFYRSNKRVLYSEYDVEMFRRIMHLKNFEGLTVAKALAQAVRELKEVQKQNYNNYEGYDPHNEASSTQVEPEGELQVELTSNKEVFEMMVQLKELIVELKASNDKKDEQIMLLLEEKDKKDRTLEERLGQRDEHLMSLVRDMQEVKKQLAASSEPKKWWEKLLGK
jgi:hypothetical protein